MLNKLINSFFRLLSQKIVEHFRRNRTMESHEDIYIRTFDMRTKKITLQFHYGPNEITPTIRVYVCPPKPEYGCEIKFNEDENVVDAVSGCRNTLCGTDRYSSVFSFFSQTNHHERNVSKLKRYHVLLDQLNAQEECQKAYKKRCDDIAHTLSEHKMDMANPILNFSLYDPLRNSGARSLRMAQQEQYEKQRCAALSASPDFIAPYLVRFVSGRPDATESIEIYEKCLKNIQTDYTELLNCLQQLYEQVSHFGRTRSSAMNDLFNHFRIDFGRAREFEEISEPIWREIGGVRLSAIRQRRVSSPRGSKTIFLIDSNRNNCRLKMDLTKRTTQQRIIDTEEEFKEKYERVKEQLRADNRLDLSSLKH